jgi:hypothetical protein
MEITGQMLRDAFKKNPSKLCHVLGEAIRGFGYPDITDKEVLEITRQAVNGNVRETDPVYLLINDWFTNGM